MIRKKRIIRETRLPDDTERIMKVFSAAKGVMRASGNMNQWGEGYPSLEIVKADVERLGSFVIEDDGVVVGYFAFLPSPDPTYFNIYKGQWTSDTTSYHVIHRIASVPEAHGVFRSIVDYCFTQERYIRIDTHRDNHIMRHNIVKYGFSYCGIIYLANGDERLAYDMIKAG